MVDTFTIEAATKSGTITFNTGAGDKAVLIFSLQEKAESFIDTYHSAGLRVLELTAETIRAWVAKVKQHGVTHAILDPMSGGEMKQAGNAKLDTVLAMAIGSGDTRLR
jgi:hypothetical protein